MWSIIPPNRTAGEAMARQATGIAAAAAATIGIAAVAALPGPPASASATGASKAAPRQERGGPVAPVPSGRLRITGDLRDGATVAAKGLSWRPGRLPAGDRLLSFEVGYSWQACGAKGCVAGADSTATPFAAQRYVVGHADT